MRNTSGIWRLTEGEVHRGSYIDAQQAIDSIADDEDRRIVMETFNQVPAPIVSG